MRTKCAHCLWRDEVLNKYPKECPICGESVAYAESIDRFIHLSGNSNAACWAAMIRGQVAS